MDKIIEARRNCWKRLNAYNEFVGMFGEFFAEEETDDISVAMMSLGIDLCCELNDLWKDEFDSCGNPVIWMVDRETYEVRMRDQLRAWHANFHEAMPDGKPRYMTFFYVNEEDM